MPIPNEKFNPGVVTNSAEVRQVVEWIGGRPVPTLAELYATGEYRPTRLARIDPPSTPAVRSAPKAETPATVVPAPASPIVRPAAPVAKIATGRPVIRVPAKIAPKMKTAPKK